jgi:CheY-like chemotaxis protein/DNA-binding XRE family transcriptional regulator
MNTQVSKDDKMTNEEASLQVRLGTAIRLHRLKLGITQEELAWRADMHRTYVADIERGGRNVTLRSVGHLANALQVSVADLLSVNRAAMDASYVSTAGEGEQLGEILLVEDSSTDAQLVVRAFNRARMTNPVKVLGDGEEALHYLNRTGKYVAEKGLPPQLVLLDLNLPGISGIEVLRQIKTNKATCQIPVVVLTVSQQDRNVIECGRLGAENYIVKPVEFENFSRITSALNLHWTLVTGRPKRTSGDP